MDILKMFSLKERVAVVTGGSGMYGKQIVLALAQAGARVYTASRNLESNEEYANLLRNRGLEVFAAQVNQADEKSVISLRDYILEKEKNTHILVNNAVARTMKKGWEDTPQSFDESMHINGTGLFLMTRTFGDHMAKSGGGSIINIGSYMGTLGPDDTLYKDTGMNGFVPDYFFHKGGMANFTKFTASYYGPKNIRCNVLNLGGLYNGQNEQFLKRYEERTFLKRMANETDLMGAIVYLASDSSAYLTGANIPLDGGYSAK